MLSVTLAKFCGRSKTVTVRLNCFIFFKLVTMAYKALHTGQPPYCPNCYNIMNPHGLCDLPLLLNSLFHDTTLNLARVHFESQHQNMELIAC